MFYQKKKKEYSEVSDNKLNINSDYFNIFQNELKNIFNNNNDVINKTNNEVNNDVINKTNNDVNINLIKKMFNTNYKNIELNNNDIFFLNLFINHIGNKNNE